MSFAPLRVFFRAPVATRRWRFYTTKVDGITVHLADLRSELMNEVKAAMKSKDAAASTTLRSVLSEVYAADKASNDKVPPSTIASILRKAVIRRVDAANKFTDASRPDLAEKENREVELLSKFLPPLLSEAEIDRILQEVIGALPAGTEPRKSLGRIFKEFYLKVDKSVVDPSVVKQRADKLLALAA